MSYDKATDRQWRKAENAALENEAIGTQIGNYKIVCQVKSEMAYEDEDKLLHNYKEKSTEYIMVANYLLTGPNTFDTNVDLPNDFGHVILVDMPEQAPKTRHLTKKGQREYEVDDSEKADVNAQLAEDYGSDAWRAVFHRVSPQNGWEQLVKDALQDETTTIEVEFDGQRYTYYYSDDEDEGTGYYWTEQAVRQGQYPDEQSLVQSGSFEVLPPTPQGLTAEVSGKAYYTDEEQKPPFTVVRFMRYQFTNPGASQPSFVHEVQFGNELDLDKSIAGYLNQKYPAAFYANPRVAFISVS